MTFWSMAVASAWYTYFLSLDVLDSYVSEFHCRSSFDASMSKQGVQEGMGEYERTQQVQ